MRIRTLLLLAVVATVGSIGLAGVAQGGRAAHEAAGAGATVGEAGRTAGPSSGPGREPRALAVLHRWDRRRSRAWATGDPGALARLYTPASATGRRDVRHLRRWTHRGLHVTGLREQVLALRVVHKGDRRLVVVVTDRTVGGIAIAADGRTTLPAGGWTSDRISLMRVGGRWRVAEVRAQPAR